MDSFILKKDYAAALAVMWELCLQSHLEQEDLTPYLTALWLHTTSELLKSGIFYERSEEPEEVVEDSNVDVSFIDDI